MKDAGVPAFVAMIEDDLTHPYEVSDLADPGRKIGTILLYDKLLGEGRQSKYVLDQSLFLHVPVNQLFFNFKGCTKPLCFCWRKDRILRKIMERKLQ